jgi:hypothetical protein
MVFLEHHCYQITTLFLQEAKDSPNLIASEVAEFVVTE